MRSFIESNMLSMPQDDWPLLMLKWILIKLTFIPVSPALVLEDITPDQEEAKKPR